MAAAAVFGGIQAGLSIFGAVKQSAAQKAQGEYQKSMSEINAKLAETSAKDAIFRGDEAAKNIQGQTKQLIGSQRAALAAQGINIDSGSALDIQADTARQGEIDAITVKNNAWREAWGYKVEALNSTYQGKFAQMGANAAAKNTLLTGGLQAAGYAYGAFGGSRSTTSSSTIKSTGSYIGGSYGDRYKMTPG